jgi:hypothetical protein
LRSVCRINIGNIYTKQLGFVRTYALEMPKT